VFHARPNALDVCYYQRLEKKDYTKKRSRRSYRPEVTLPNTEMYITSQPSSGLSSPPSSTTPPPPVPVLGFPSPPSPIPPPVRLQMHGGNGSRVATDSSDEDGDDDEDDEDDEFEDSEQTEATATGTDADESLTSEGELCATPDSEPRAVGADDKWVNVKGQRQHQTLLAPPPSPPLSPEAVHATVTALHP
jgi:hypothetical protein